MVKELVEVEKFRSRVWCVPTHELRFETFATFHNSMMKFARDIECVAVVTTHRERELLLQMIPTIRIIVADYYLPDIAGSKGVVNQKKLLALWILCHEYDQIIMTDDETVLRDSLPEALFSQEVSWGFTPTPDSCLSITTSLQTLVGPMRMGLDVDSKLKKFSGIYGWFSNIPMYESEYLDDFFRFLGIEGICDLEQLQWEHFDMVLYQAFFYCQFPDIFARRSHVYAWPKTRQRASLWESGPTTVLQLLRLTIDSHKRKIFWASNPIVPKLFPDAIAAFHVDRDFRFSIGGFTFLSKLRSMSKIPISKEPQRGYLEN